MFTIAALTDWLDGYLARRLEQSTPFGAFLDPVADKLMVAVALVLLVEEHSNLWLTLPAAIIIGREIVVSALREWMAEARCPRTGRGVESRQMEDRGADGGAGDPAGQSAAADNMGRHGVRIAHRRGRADAVVDDQLPDGCLAAPEHYGKK